MNWKQIPLAAALALALGLTAGCSQEAPPAADTGTEAVAETAHADEPAGADAHDAAHGHAEALGVDFPVPANHEPWAPDAPLIEGMSRVRAAIAGLETGPDEATVVARAADVDAAVEYMFANCSLPTEPDVALHAILARLMAGSEALKDNPSDTAAVADMHGAVANYEQLFDDPNS
ncbi:DnrO protein [Luteimonas granuli]|uniref:DnrO protein n=1 Tax=Luteimonas granuli TaxID=1176533 RepID=A0A518N2G4_9GAMM|nr:DnrO protein [Luteimonas granuli]QDW66125.1 DnrO protein [Luteimonas granuli]